jgi:molybdenum-dependent DNA-binding transcriptional regulator ModE
MRRLDRIADHGSVAGVGRVPGLSCRRAWKLVEAQTGGRCGGGARFRDLQPMAWPGSGRSRRLLRI